MSGKGFVGVTRRGIAGNPVGRPFGFGALEDDEVEECNPQLQSPDTQDVEEVCESNGGAQQVHDAENNQDARGLARLAHPLFDERSGAEQPEAQMLINMIVAHATALGCSFPEEPFGSDVEVNDDERTMRDRTGKGIVHDPRNGPGRAVCSTNFKDYFGILGGEEEDLSISDAEGL
uniref:Uncharacterized protein n=1 Tax=Eutreptiella gymnastica TaxID=73025 RepID=A0A7S1IHU3_9EUGL|mmetsp:Transcript_18955/g.33516  ORF Transcript_18955/g.33516 Transcript_18955/m.33516 type:complete len:176 (+) Transcript_18955:22-549(+)